jgi:hypothetical protein
MKRKLPKKNIKKIAKVHAIFSFAIFAFYIALSSIYSPEFLLSDVRSKFSAIAETINVVAKVLAPPIVPIVSVTPTCNNGDLFNTINWPFDENSTSFSIDRDGIPLITGITSNYYKDNVISLDTSYTYIVTAFGPMGPGMATSLPITITSLADCVYIAPLPAPTLTIDILKIPGQFDLDYPNEVFSTRPTFFGSVNMPNAIIKLAVHSSLIVLGETTVNAAGYWTWTSPVDITEGPHTLFVIATDPNDSTRTISSSFDFEVESDDAHDQAMESDNNNDSKKDSKKNKTTPIIQKSKPIENNNNQNIPKENTINPTETPFDFSLSLKDANVQQGKDAFLTVKIEKLSKSYLNQAAIFNYKLFDKQNNEVFSTSEKNVLSVNAIISKNITIAKYLKPGAYQLQVEIVTENYSYSKRINLNVTSSPAINLGGGFAVTYPELLSQLGTISLWLLLLLLIWLFLFSREYWLYLHALRHITEKNLQKLGLISLKKNK